MVDVFVPIDAFGLVEDHDSDDGNDDGSRKHLAICSALRGSCRNSQGTKRENRCHCDLALEGQA